MALRTLVFAGLLLQAGRSFADAVDNEIRSEMHKRHIPGLALAIVRNGKVIRSKGYGFANLELGIRATPDTVFSLHSVSKQFCAAGIMLLIRDGKIKLDDPVTRYFPECSPAWDAIQVRHLLNHTSGIPDYLNEDLKLPDAASDSAIPGAVSKLPLKFAPGSKFAYSNTGYLMLALMIHQLTGRPDPEFLRERIFKPLGMASSRTSSQADIIPRRAARYDWQNGHFVNGRPPSTVPEIGDGGMLSTVLDLARWDAALYTDRILTAGEIRLMWTPGPYDEEEKAHYGFGFYLDSFNGHRRVWHYGAGFSGERSVIARYVDDKVTVIILVNGGEPKLPALVNRIAAQFLNDRKR
jgi:CubicO group peptidase (beta-lactamase class C family)